MEQGPYGVFYAHAAATREVFGSAPRSFDVAQKQRASSAGLAPSPGKPKATVMRGADMIRRPIVAGDRRSAHYRQLRP
jgi:hypothetical protein